MANKDREAPARLAARTARGREGRGSCPQCRGLSGVPGGADAWAAQAAHLERHLREELRRQRSA